MDPCLLPDTSKHRAAHLQQGARPAPRPPRRSALAGTVLLLGLLAATTAQAYVPLPVEMRQNQTLYNARAVRGVPISSVTNNPPGSDGRMPSGLNESGTYNVPTANQFQGAISFGGVSAPSNWRAKTNSPYLTGTNTFSWRVAEAMQLPSAKSNGVILMIARSIRVGMPYLSRGVSLSFGSLVQVPDTDENGATLSGAKENYWLPEPYSTTGHTNTGYYWSPHARQVYAIQPGPVYITWRKAASYVAASVPTDYVNQLGQSNFETNGTSIYLLYTVAYVVSGSSVKLPRTMYWTEHEFQSLGRPVSIPSSRVGAVNIVYNNGFPRTVASEYHGPGYTNPNDGSTNATLQELRTLWYDQAQGFLYAYNFEGRVFVELLGDLRGDGQTRVPLGYEIVDVVKQPTPLDIDCELGERLVPPMEASADDLVPEEIQQATLTAFTVRYFAPGSSQPELYAACETKNVNDCLVHWLEKGVEGVLWPNMLGRHHLVWPSDEAKYSHYIRPAVATEAEAQATAVSLNAMNVPMIAYQDAFDRPRAKLTSDFKFYTFLESAYPAHRTLLRFTVNDRIAFERVFSWLDASVRASTYANSVATNLASIRAFANYPALYAAYTNNLALSNAAYQVALGKYSTYLVNYSNYLVQAAAYTNSLLAYTNYQIQYKAYTNYLAGRSRGVNTNWTLSLADWWNNSKEGTLGGWALQILYTNLQTGLLATNTYSNSTTLAISYSGGTASTITVAGMTNPVVGIRAKLNNLTHGSGYDIHAWLAGPGGRSVTLLDTPGGANVAISGVMLDLDDGGAAASYYNASFTSGTYRPSAGLMSSLLDAALGPVVDPGPAPVIGAAPVPPTWMAEPQPPDLAGPADSLWSDRFHAPRLVEETVTVGSRIVPPEGEPGNGRAYLAGYINQSQGNLFNPQAYVDPLSRGFDLANAGAIIPVNAIPGANSLEIWWFRPNTSRAGLNAGNTNLGFSTIYWPAYVGRYTIQWPSQPREIVLASKLGSGTLDTFEAQGVIYSQNQRELPGYNPNEEHALMSGGTAFATRDDLNLTSGQTYSSAPYVLLSYTAEDRRPAMSVFKVLREKPSAGYVFDYVVPAGQIVQPPPPLTFLQQPVDGAGMYASNYNVEVSHSGADLPGGWTAEAQAGEFGHYDAFTWSDRKHNTWVYRGPHAGIPTLAGGSYNPTNKSYGALPSAQAVVGQDFAFAVHASRQDENLTLLAPNGMPGWLRTSGLMLLGRPDTGDVGSTVVSLVVADLYDGSRVTNSLSLTVVASGSVNVQQPLALVSSNAYTRTVVTFSNRPPFLAASPTASNSFTMRYYYKTEPSFDWPGITNPPAAGSIVPYLRPVDPASGTYVGRPDSKDTAALEIVYRPVWPVRDPKDSTKPLPTLPFGATLTQPAFNLPGVRDMLTARVLYQQSVARDVGHPAASVVLHDATREKYSDLDAQKLTGVPSSIKTEYYQGNYFFPNLPPHLGKRVFYQPNRGAKGTLVLKGAYVQEALGESYTLLNVLRDSDLQAVKDLCPASDTTYKAQWDALVAALATDLETFQEDPLKPGTYIPDELLTVSVGVGDLAEVRSDETAVASYALSATGPGEGYVTLIEGNGWSFTKPGDPVSMHIFKAGTSLHTGETKVLAAENPLSEQVTFQHTADLAGRFSEFEYEWKIAAPVDGLPPQADATMSRYQTLALGTDLPRRTLGGVGIQSLTDNYVVMRYRPINPAHPLYNQWSDWTSPKLAEGWIKRVLAGINPFNQRLGDLFNNAVNTDASMLTQAGRRWEGDVALNLSTINNYGLIEIYETVLRRGRMLSIESGYNYGPANDALLLAAGYLNDLYMLVGNEAWADAANPTIGIGTKNSAYGDVATALFSFKGQVSSLLDEELALLRGRDDFLLPGVQVAPVYNRLVWNYTRGIDSGEVIYALNYNIQEDSTRTPDGVINAADAAVMFPQGHGDAYGHYLTALKGYYSLLLNAYFDWVPRIEAVNVLGQPVSVDYLDERKFAAAAAAVARAGQQVVDLTWRKDYSPVATEGWAHLSGTRTNSQRQVVEPEGTNAVVRYWGTDHWASRTGQGAYINWVVGNAILSATDPNPLHEGIQKVDRSTVPELSELATIAQAVQTSLENAEGGLSPLGIPEGGIAFDLNPNAVVGADNGTHFEQVYQRAKVALNNAVSSFDDAKDVTRLMRSEQDSLADVKTAVAQQELAYNNSLIELYGTPYPDDIGAGKTWQQGYTGPDLIHYSYINIPESDFGGNVELDADQTFRVDTQTLPDNWVERVAGWNDADAKNMNWVNDNQYIEFTWGQHGFFNKPKSWSGSRRSPGKIQQAISDLVKAHNNVTAALSDAEGAKQELNDAVRMFKSAQSTATTIDGINRDLNIADEVFSWANAANDVYEKFDEASQKAIDDAAQAAKDAIPTSFIAGLAAGGDVTSVARGALEGAAAATKGAIEVWGVIRFGILKAYETANATARRWEEAHISSLEADEATKQALVDLGGMVDALTDHYTTINARLREYDDALRNYQALLAQGDRIQEERLVFRQRAAAIVQGYRVRDAAFRLFRNEKLERYKTLFDLAARYSLLAANAYDYETGLLGTSTGRDFKKRLINARALGVVRNGDPQFAGSDTGDPGLSSALAEMKADWDVLRGRLGFNSPDAYGTTVSLRTEGLRILPTSDGDSAWKDVLQNARVKNILEDPDVRRYCMQVDNGSGLPVPGIVLTFSTTIADGYNLFGRELAAGDHAFSPSSFATKIFGLGVAFSGYRGMDDPTANSGAVSGSGGSSPTDPSVWYLDPLALAATPYVYLIPVGVDSMRSPPLGDSSTIRTWNVEDVAIPMPFNVGGSDLSSLKLWQSADSLTEPLFAIRKHQAFRPVSTTAVFSPSLYGVNGTLVRSQFTNNRLVGRSVWNSQWKLVIPGRTLLSNPDEGLDRFIQTVTDVKLHFVTYSYSGN